MSDKSSASVDVEKLCPHANPLVHYFRLGARSISTFTMLLLLGLVAVAIPLYYLVTYKFGEGISYIIRGTGLVTATAMGGQIAPTTFLTSMSFLLVLFQFVAFRLLWRDPRRGDGILDLVLTLMTPKQIVWGAFRTPVLATVIVMGVVLAGMFGRMAMMEIPITVWRATLKGSICDAVPAFLIVVLTSTYLNVRGCVLGGARGLLVSASVLLLAPVFIGLGVTELLASHNSIIKANYVSSIAASIPSRLLVLWMGFAILSWVVWRVARTELVESFMQGAHPEESIRSYWMAREQEGKKSRAAMAEGRGKLRAVVGRDWIADFLVALASQLGWIAVLQAFYRAESIEVFYRDTFLVSIASILSTCSVVLRRNLLPPRLGVPVVSGDLRGSVRRWFLPILVAQCFGGLSPLLFSAGIEVNHVEYALGVLAGVLLGYGMFLALIPRAYQKHVFGAIWNLIAALCATVVFAAYLDQYSGGSAAARAAVWSGMESPRGIDYMYSAGFVLRAFAFFFGISLILGLRGLLLQRIHESEVLHHPIGALSTDPLPDAAKPPA